MSLANKKNVQMKLLQHCLDSLLGHVKDTVPKTYVSNGNGKTEIC